MNKILQTAYQTTVRQIIHYDLLSLRVISYNKIISCNQFVRKFLPVSVLHTTRKQSTHTTSTITHKNTVLLKNIDCACENLNADSIVHVFPLKR